MTRTFSKVAHSASVTRQRGISMSMLLVIMCVTVFLATFAFKAGPAYFENWTVQKVVDQVTSDETVMRGSRKAVYKQINTMFGHNNLWHLKAEDIVTLQKDGNSFLATVAYEKRETLFSNIDLVMSFSSAKDDSESN